MTQTFIIAEAGVNHNGSFLLAQQLIDAAKESGVDAVKFQTFKAENLVTKSAHQAEYQIENIGETSSQYAMLKNLELTFDEFKMLKKYCDDKGIYFLSTPFDFESVDFLVDDLGMDIVKIPSGELTNLPFLHYIATKQKRMIISTGMATMDEIHESLAFIAHGLAFPNEPIVYNTVKKYYEKKEAKQLLQRFVTILHCTTEYPAPMESINLLAMHDIAKETTLEVGFSDHSQGIAVPIAAVAQGAKIIEKHFTLDKTLAGPDHIASLEPTELKQMTVAIRQIEKALGDGVKKPAEVEVKNKTVARKSLVALQPILEGETFTTTNLGVKRPGNGINSNQYWNYLNQSAKKSYGQDELIDE